MTTRPVTTDPATAPPPLPSVLDGGLATQLEAMGHDLSSSLWSASVLRTDPGALTEAHRAFFAAGAQVATTATYQLTPDSLERAGMPRADFAPLLRLALDAAREARDGHGSGWVVGSVGPYGASLADGSEYTGAYGLPDGAAGQAALREHHRDRLAALAEAGVDALAIETLPTLAEVDAVVAELNSLGVTIPAWFSVTPATGGLTTRTGEPVADLASRATAYAHVVAVGVNCCPPEGVESALRAIDPTAHGVAGVAYPNSGETWDAVGRRWLGDAAWEQDAVSRWRAAGATMVGGCCRVFPDQIAGIAPVD